MIWNTYAYLCYLNVDRMLDQLCDLELWPQPWPWHWMFRYSISNFRIPVVVFQQWMFCLVWNESDMSRQHDAYSVLPWPLRLPMTLTLKNNHISEITSDINLAGGKHFLPLTLLILETEYSGFGVNTMPADALATLGQTASIGCIGQTTCIFVPW